MSDADRLVAELRARALVQSKLAMEKVWEAFRSVVRGYTGSADARARLAELLDELASRGEIGLPSGRKFWLHDAKPPLPSWVRVAVARRPAAASVNHRAMAWPPELAFVAALPRAPPLLQDLLAIRRFLADGGRDAVPVPLRERSLEVFGDEKRLDVLLRSELFRSRRLSLELLRCCDVAPPLVWEAVERASTPAVLIVENLHSYDSFRRWNARVAAYAAVAYGHGHSFKATVCDLPRVCTEVGAEHAEYFGDVDAAGLEIPVYARAVLRRIGSTVELRPAERWYAMLLAMQGRAATETTPPVDSLRSLAWLSDALQSAARDLLLSGRRLAQEWVGTRVLAALDR